MFYFLFSIPSHVHFCLGPHMPMVYLYKSQALFFFLFSFLHINKILTDLVINLLLHLVLCIPCYSQTDYCVIWRLPSWQLPPCWPARIWAVTHQHMYSAEQAHPGHNHPARKSQVTDIFLPFANSEGIFENARFWQKIIQ
jgi:hypothetical protein